MRRKFQIVKYMDKDGEQDDGRKSGDQDSRSRTLRKGSKRMRSARQGETDPRQDRLDQGPNRLELASLRTRVGFTTGQTVCATKRGLGRGASTVLLATPQQKVIMTQDAC